MINSKQYITDLSEICFHKGVKYIVISPGSRNAPLIEAFFKRFGGNCISIVDERSAGYFALGLARNANSPVVLLCTSGTAVLNYGPALAEAYYQRISLIAITADRPEELIDQQDNQTIRQKDIFKNITKASCNLSHDIISENILRETHKIIENTVDTCLSGSKGPVHINVPIIEPLYDKLPPASEFLSGGGSGETAITTEFSLSDDLCERYKNARHILIVHGQDFEDSKTSSALSSLSSSKGAVVVAENIANITGEKIISTPELLLAHNKSGELISPDLIIYSGGQIVSKKLKAYIRALKEVECWRIGEDEYEIDTFQKSNLIISVHCSKVYSILNTLTALNRDNEFQESWLKAKSFTEKIRLAIIRDAVYSDLKVHHLILSNLPAEVNLELGNSSIIRYSQIFPADSGITYYSNRGVSGIDGCLSAASGTAYSSGKLTIAVVGDLSFVYDSNAMWNRALSANLRIIVINNSGGDIFSLIDGPSESQAFNKFHKAHHPVNIQKLAEAFNLGYFCVENEDQLKASLTDFFSESKKPLLMEVKTKSKNNRIAFDLIMGRKTLSENPE